MSTSDITVTKDFVLPIETITRRIAAIGMSGSGKSNTACVLVEHFLDLGAQVVILDNDGTWYGLRLAPDGKGKGYDIPVFGGDHGDIPLDFRSGALVADVIVDRGISVVLDVSDFRKGQRHQFATDFAEQLYHRKKSKKTPMMFVIEEAQDFLPQRFGKDQARMVGAYEDITKGGRKYGIGSMIISQRPQAINKDGLNQAEILFAHYTYGSQERKALADWITNKNESVDIVEELPFLEVGQAYVWSPRWLKTMRKVQIPLKRTFDAAATPVFGRKQIAPPTLAPVDLERLQDSMREAIQKAEENDPAALKRKIQQLTGELSRAKSAHSQQVTVQPPEPQIVRVPILETSQIDELKRVIVNIEVSQTEFAATLDNLAEAINAALDLATKTNHVTPARPPPTVQLQPITPRPIRASGGEGTLTNPQQRVLDAIAWMDSIGIEDPSQVAVAFLAGYTHGGGSFNNIKSSLNSAGLVTYQSNNRIELTDAGRRLANHMPLGLTADALQERVFNVLPGPECAILKTILRYYPNMVSKEAVANNTNSSRGEAYAPGGGSFTNPVSRLKTLGLIEYPAPGHVRAASLLFLEPQ